MPVLLLVTVVTYFFPLFWPNNKPKSPPQVQIEFPDPLSPHTRDLFELVRPAVAQIKVMHFAKRKGGLGTGFFISQDGLMLTAYHVVSDAQIYTVKLLDGRMLEAHVKAFDAINDIALLKVRSRDEFPYLPLAIEPPTTGEQILAIGNSDGDYLQPRIGKLLNLKTPAVRPDFPQNTLEMSAPLAQGDSGGPILDKTGQVIGVVSYVRMDMQGQTHTSHAIPVTTKSALINNLYQGKKRDRPVIGVVIDGHHSDLGQSSGVMISRVARNSPAASAGLRGCQKDRRNNTIILGDIITNINGTPISNAHVYARYLNNRQIGETITLTYRRDDKKFQTKIKLAARTAIKDLDREKEPFCH